MTYQPPRLEAIFLWLNFTDQGAYPPSPLPPIPHWSVWWILYGNVLLVAESFDSLWWHGREPVLEDVHTLLRGDAPCSVLIRVSKQRLQLVLTACAYKHYYCVRIQTLLLRAHTNIITACAYKHYYCVRIQTILTLLLFYRYFLSNNLKLFIWCCHWYRIGDQTWQRYWQRC